MLLVLAAGFIGQFGKRLADHLLARRRRKFRAADPGPDSQTSGASGSEVATPHVAADGAADGARVVTSAAAKAAKKAAKAEVKRLKKGRPPKEG